MNVCSMYTRRSSTYIYILPIPNYMYIYTIFFQNTQVLLASTRALRARSNVGAAAAAAAQVAATPPRPAQPCAPSICMRLSCCAR